MTQVGNTNRRIQKLKELVAVYFELPDKAHIERHTEKLHIFDICNPTHPNHPHELHRVYISRRALKHVVEARKHELLKSYSPNEALGNIIFAIEQMQETITNFDLYEYEPPRHRYTKDYLERGMPSQRIVVDLAGNVLEICSVHFNRYIAPRNK